MPPGPPGAFCCVLRCTEITAGTKVLPHSGGDSYSPTVPSAWRERRPVTGSCRVATEGLSINYMSFEDYLAFYKVNEERAAVFIYAVFNGRLDYQRYMKRYL